MIIALGGDHAGVHLKAITAERLRQAGHEVHDLGPQTPERTAVLPFAREMCAGIANGTYERGILLCATGVGAAIIANKHKGVRATVCSDTYTARQCVEHDDVNIICVGSRTVGSEVAQEIIETFLASRFLDVEPYKTRMQGILGLDQSERSC